MDKKLVIHIGLRKAGSSTIQQFLNVNTVDLKLLGCDYPRVGRRARWSHMNIAADVRQLGEFDAYYGSVNELRAYLKSQAFPLTIISSEVFEPASRENIEHLRDVLRPGFSDSTILLIIRDPKGLIPSSYAESVGSGRKTMGFDTFFDQLIGMRRLNYFHTAKRWALVWGWKSINVRLLDREHMLNGDLIDDFMAAAGVDVEDSRYRALQRPKSANVSPGWKVIEALRALYGGEHRLAADHPLISSPRNLSDTRIIRSCAQDVGDRLGWNADRGVYLTQAQAEQCAEVFAESLEDLNARISNPAPSPAGLDETGFKERDFLPDATLIAPAELRGFYDELGARYLMSRTNAADNSSS